jgi:hypothetical protein
VGTHLGLGEGTTMTTGGTLTTLMGLLTTKGTSSTTKGLNPTASAAACPHARVDEIPQGWAHCQIMASGRLLEYVAAAAFPAGCASKNMACGPRIKDNLLHEDPMQSSEPSCKSQRTTNTFRLCMLPCAQAVLLAVPTPQNKDKACDWAVVPKGVLAKRWPYF